MRNTRFVNLQALKDSFSLVKKHLGREDQKDSSGSKPSFLSRIRENGIIATNRSSNIYEYIKTEFPDGYVEGDGYVILASENIPGRERTLKRSGLTRR